jgi:predicted histidine transporter YuiF (NhaC family)
MNNQTRTRIIVAVGIVVALYLWYRREQYDSEKEDEIKDVAKDKKLSQEELDAVIKFIKN